MANESVHNEAAFETLEQRWLLSASLEGDLWTIRGDVDQANPNDWIVIAADRSDSALLRATVSSLVTGEVLAEYTQPAAAVGAIRVVGGAGDDLIQIRLADGYTMDIMLIGGKGDDTLIGAGGDDSLNGGEGDDSLIGGPGRDRLVGGRGNDRLEGGDDADSLYGGNGADGLYGGEGSDVLFGGAGADILSGGAGFDVLTGGGGDDVLRGDSGMDMLHGGGGADAIYGSEQFDLIKSGRGDTISPDLAAQLIDDGGFAGSAADLNSLIDAIVNTYAQWFAMGPQDTSPMGYFTLNESVELAAAASAVDTGPGILADPGGIEGHQIVVSEGDLVATDGEYLYLFADGGLVIVDASVGDEFGIISETEIEGDPVAMYLDGDRLTVISAKTPVSYDYVIGGMLINSADSSWVKVTVLDVSDRSAPSVGEQTLTNGRHVGSTIVEGQLRMAVSNALAFDAPAWTYDEAIGKYVVESELAFRQRLAEALPGLIPQYITADGGDADGQVSDLVDLGELYAYGDKYEGAVLSVIHLDLTDDDVGLDAATSISTGPGGRIYATDGSLYVASVDQGDRLDDFPSMFVRHDYSATTIRKLDLTDPAMPVVATGWFFGSLIGPDAMDEHDGHLRIAARTGPSFYLFNTVMVFNQIGDTLQRVGSVSVSPSRYGETVQFDGGRAFIASGYDSGMLYSLDLADPTNPMVVGEAALGLPAEYRARVSDMVVIDQDHVIVFTSIVGLNSDSVEGLFLVDLTDPANPEVLDTYEYSGYEWGGIVPMAYYSDQGILVLPIFNRADGSDGAFVFDVTVAGEMEFLGQVHHDNDHGIGHASRSVVIDGNLYTISETQVKVTPIDQPQTVLGALELPYTMTPAIQIPPIIVMPFPVPRL